MPRLFLAALLLAPALSSKAASKGDGSRLMRTEMEVTSGGEASPHLHTPALLEHVADNTSEGCTMANVFGPDNRTWPINVSDAKTIQVAFCVSHNYSKATCTGVIDEHFKGFTDEASPFNMTSKFCQVSLDLLKLDALHRAGASPAILMASDNLMVESSLVESNLTLQREEWWLWSDCKTACEVWNPNTQKKESKPRVYNANFTTTPTNLLPAGDGCVCDWAGCGNKDWAAANLCRAQCNNGEGICGQCFPSSAAASVQLPGGTVVTRAMKHLNVGDAVLTQRGFSKIFAFMDHMPDSEAEYVQLQTSSGYELSLTADHIVYAHAGRTPVLAGSIVEGDTLWTTAGADADFIPSRVVSVQSKLELGMHAPLTHEGSLVVNGVLSSSYAKVKSLRWGDHVIVSGHDLNKYMHEPLRIACSAIPSLCDREWHSAEGRHVWTQFILDKFGWLAAMNQAHSDLEAALLAKPSALSWLAGFAQLGVALLLLAVFDPASRVSSLAILAGACLLARRRGNAGKA